MRELEGDYQSRDSNERSNLVLENADTSGLRRYGIAMGRR
jgi:hypothetical protein